MNEVLHVSGLKEAQRALYAYSQQMGDRVVYMALRTGANHMKKVVQAGAPIKTGKLRRGFRVARSRIYNGRRDNELIGVYLTLRKGRGAPFYGRFVNDGWNTHGPRRTLENTPGRRTRRGRMIFSRGAIIARFGQANGRMTLPGKTDVPGQGFVQKAFESARTVAAELIVRNALAGAEAVKRRVGLK